ncbi:MAG: protein-methionine-sulfoxide reductase heme-binding subunit MsrQ [Pseudomonadota bacterium]
MEAVATLGPRVSGAARRVPTWIVYVLGLLPGIWAIFQAFSMVDPVEKLTHSMGLIALQFLLTSLCVTPLLRFARINLIKFRKALGLLAFGYLTVHFLVWLLLDLQLMWGQIGTDIVKRPYLTLGFAGFVLLIPLAATSFQRAMKWMGPLAWARLHRLVYLTALLGGVHFIMQEKVWTTESMVYLALAVLLVGLRFTWIRRW